MPLLGPADESPHPPRRVLVAGTSGSGKSTTASLVARAPGLPHVEPDPPYHGPQWTPRPGFEADVGRFAKLGAWATEWQRSAARPVLPRTARGRPVAVRPAAAGRGTG